MTAVLGWRDLLCLRGQPEKRASVSREAGRASPRGGEAAARGCSKRESAGKSRVAVNERVRISRRAGGNPGQASDQLFRLGRRAETFYYGGGEADGGRGSWGWCWWVVGTAGAGAKGGARAERSAPAVGESRGISRRVGGNSRGASPPQKAPSAYARRAARAPRPDGSGPSRAARDSARESVLRIGRLGPHGVKPLRLHAVVLRH